MKTRNVIRVMGLIMFVGCLTTYLFVEFHNKRITENSFVPKKISYDEVYEPAFNKINSLIASQENKNSEFIVNLKKEMLDLKITKEIRQHEFSNSIGLMATYPLMILWGSIAVVGFLLLRAKESHEKSIIRSYEKILDHLEISYSQGDQIDKSHVEAEEIILDKFRPTSNEEV